MRMRKEEKTIFCSTSDKKKRKTHSRTKNKTNKQTLSQSLLPQRHLLRGRRHLRRHRRHHPPDEDRVRRQEAGRHLAHLGVHERLRAPCGGPDDGVGQPRVRALRGRGGVVGGAVGRGELDAVRQDPGGGDLWVRAGAVRGESFFFHPVF